MGGDPRRRDATFLSSPSPRPRISWRKNDILPPRSPRDAPASEHWQRALDCSSSRGEKPDRVSQFHALGSHQATDATHNMDMDMALDDLIKKAPKKPRPNKKKAAAGKGKGTPAKKGPGGVKAKVIGKARRGPRGGNASVAMAVDGAWAHDKFQGGRGRGPAVGGSAKLAISNLHFNVTNQDIKVRRRPRRR